MPGARLDRWSGVKHELSFRWSGVKHELSFDAAAGEFLRLEVHGVAYHSHDRSSELAREVKNLSAHRELRVEGRGMGHKYEVGRKSLEFPD